MRRIALAALALAGALPAGSALACGGLVCNNTQPVTQAAERILFAQDGETLHMVVRLTYQGPPIDFGWLLPVPQDVTSRLASEALFTALDGALSPRFVLQTEFDPICFERQRANQSPWDEQNAGWSDAGAAPDQSAWEEPEPPPPPPPVQVISREVVGPYDQVVLRADRFADLQEWLVENDFQVPADGEAVMQPYLDAGAAFLALKLVADAQSADVVPLHLTFTGDTPAIPMRPTAVAAEPDMGVLVHLLGPARAVSTNYLHVEINAAALDWAQGGVNYPDVVSHAVDEAAGGRAFVTDAAGPTPRFPLWVLPAGLTEDLAAVADLARFVELMDRVGAGWRGGDPDVARLVPRFIHLPAVLAAQTDVAGFLRCMDCFGVDFSEIGLDGAAFAEALDREVGESRALLSRLYAEHPWMTRLYTTLSAPEMVEDPVFAFNRDLPEIMAQRTATQHVSCDAVGNWLFDEAILALADGRRLPFGARALPAVRRQAGETVRGQDTLGAVRIERMFAAGQPEIIEDRSADLDRLAREALGGAGSAPPGGDPARPGADPGAGPGAGAAAADGSHCGGCNAPAAPSALGGLALLLLTLRRRRR